MATQSKRRKELLEEVRRKFSGLLGRGEGKISISEAARVLNVSRQTVHRYINGEVMPRGEVLMAAFRAWGLVLEYRGVHVTRTESPGQGGTEVADPVQMRLFDIVDELRDRDLEVKIGKMSADGLELKIKIRFTA